MLSILPAQLTKLSEQTSPLVGRASARQTNLTNTESRDCGYVNMQLKVTTVIQVQLLQTIDEIQLRASARINKEHVPHDVSFTLHSPDLRSVVFQKARCFEWHSLGYLLKNRKRRNWEVEGAAILWRV